MTQGANRFTTSLMALAMAASISPIFSTGAAAQTSGPKPLPGQHKCSDRDFFHSHGKLCDSIAHLIHPRIDQSSDLLRIPHRGLWGTNNGEGPSENTMAALRNALDNHYAIIEIDTALYNVIGDNGKVYLGHYFDKHAFNPYIDPRLVSDVRIARMKKRSMKPGMPGILEDDLTSVADAIDWARSNQVLLMIDPKTPEHHLHNEYAKIIADVLLEAKNRDALQNIVIKTDRSFAESISAIQSIVGVPYSDIAGKFLWSPIINKNAKDTFADSIAIFDDWQSNTDFGSDVAMYEIGIFGSCHWASEPFYYHGRHYVNFIDYILFSSRYYNRPSLWSLDPANYLGTLSRVYKWKMLGNYNACRIPKLVTGDNPDMRGDPYDTFRNAWAEYAVINTDTPGFYAQFGE